MGLLRRVLPAGFCVGLLFSACDRGNKNSCTDDSKLTLFEKRIAPLLADGTRTACNECHLQGVDLGVYSPDGDECRTMACMVQTGIVDLDKPEDSTVLGWILKSNPKSPLITSDVLQQEHDGMLEWIEYHASCGQDACGDLHDIKDPCDKKQTSGSCDVPESGHDLPPRGFEDPGDCSDVTIEKAFDKLVYSWRGRCYPCHWDSRPGDPPDAPRWIVDDECNLGAASSMRNVLNLGLVDRDAPHESLLLLKPLSEDYGGVAHMGLTKFDDKTDGAYNDFKTWIDLYVSCTPP